MLTRSGHGAIDIERMLVIAFLLVFSIPGCRSEHTMETPSSGKGALPEGASVEPQTLVAEVTMVDGSKVDVNDLVFVYRWTIESPDRATYSEKSTSSPDLHYREVKTGVEIDRVVPRRELSEVTWHWTRKEANWRLLEGIEIRRSSGEGVVLQDMGQTRIFLLGRMPQGDEMDRVTSQGIKIRGWALVEGQRGSFELDLVNKAGAQYDIPQERNVVSVKFR